MLLRQIICDRVKTLSSLQLCFNLFLSAEALLSSQCYFCQHVGVLLRNIPASASTDVFSAYILAVRLQFQSRDGVGRKGRFHSGESLL